MTPKEKHFWETASNSKLCFPDLVSNNSPAEGFPWASKQRNSTCIFSLFFFHYQWLQKPHCARSL